MNLGRIAIVARGVYDSALQYEKLDFVTHNESSYVAKEEILIGEQPGVSSKWQLACKKGTIGKDGKDGVNGANGTNGINGKNAFELWQIENPSGTYNDFKNDIIRKKSISLLKNYASSSNILTEVNDLKFNLQSGKNYRIKLLGTVQSVAITTGINIAFTFDGNIIANGFVESSLTHLASATTLRSTIFNIDASTATTIGSNLITTGTGAVNTPVMLNAEMVVRCIDSGTFKTWFASEINASQAQLNIGTTFIIEEF